MAHLTLLEAARLPWLELLAGLIELAGRVGRHGRRTHPAVIPVLHHVVNILYRKFLNCLRNSFGLQRKAPLARDLAGQLRSVITFDFH